MGEKPWDDPEEKLNKKLRKIGRSAAYALGGAIGLWLVSAFFPKEEGHEKITTIMNDIALMLTIYGLVLLLGIILKKKHAPIINIIMTWIIAPAWIASIFLSAKGF